MSSSGRDISEILPSTIKHLGIEQFANIMTMLNRRTIPQDNDEDLYKHIIFAPLLDIHNVTVILAGADIDKDETQKLYCDSWGIRKFIPDNVRAYDLTHNNTNAGGLTFPSPGQTPGDRHMGVAVTNGSSYMIINDHDWLDPTTEITVACFAYLPAVTSGDKIIVKKDLQYELKLTATNTLSWRIYSGGAWKTARTYVYTPNTWYNIVATYKSTSSGQKLYVNGTLQSSDAETGAINTTANNLGIFGEAGGTNLTPNGFALSWLILCSSEASSTWVSDYNTKGIANLDTDSDGLQEITTIPFIGSYKEMPNSYAGMFIGS